MNQETTDQFVGLLWRLKSDLKEAHEPEVRTNHHGDGPLNCSYCQDMADAEKLLEQFSKPFSPICQCCKENGHGGENPFSGIPATHLAFQSEDAGQTVTAIYICGGCAEYWTGGCDWRCPEPVPLPPQSTK